MLKHACAYKVVSKIESDVDHGDERVKFDGFRKSGNNRTKYISEESALCYVQITIPPLPFRCRILS
jgi:hypothetical protein